MTAGVSVSFTSGMYYIFFWVVTFLLNDTLILLSFSCKPPCLLIKGLTKNNQLIFIALMLFYQIPHFSLHHLSFFLCGQHPQSPLIHMTAHIHSLLFLSSSLTEALQPKKNSVVTLTRQGDRCYTLSIATYDNAWQKHMLFLSWSKVLAV